MCRPSPANSDPGSILAAPAVLRAGAVRAEPRVLKISHQFPGGTLDQGDFRDRLCRKFAAEVEKRTNGALKVEVYPGSSLMKTNAQFSALRKGALDISALSAVLRRRRGAGGQHRPDARAGDQLRAGRGLEEGRRSARS